MRVVITDEQNITIEEFEKKEQKKLSLAVLKILLKRYFLLNNKLLKSPKTYVENQIIFKARPLLK
jgi:hypothetical protein